MDTRFFELQCGYKTYEWGRIGHESCIAKYLLSAEPCRIINNNEYYAELQLWMGVHPASSSFVRLSTKHNSEEMVLLQTLLDEDERLVSHEVAQVYGKTLPFLFKVLSVRTALSIQAHPDKKLAETLHRQDPEHYPGTYI
ncbi:hypothetical protein PMAC_001846 [Pneumocystis sp. 'macacae']|nr:hypothetical protein PMAC_001846 [Pneumocystis sp. 'macacae']